MANYNKTQTPDFSLAEAKELELFSELGRYQKGVAGSNIYWSKQLFMLFDIPLNTPPEDQVIIDKVHEAQRESFKDFLTGKGRKEIEVQVGHIANPQYIKGRVLDGNNEKKGTVSILFKNNPSGANGSSLQPYNLIEYAPDAILVIGLQGNILGVNKKARDVFGYPEHDLLTLNVKSLFWESKNKSKFPPLSDLEDYQTNIIDWTLKDKKGNKVEAEVSYTKTGEYVQCIVRDNTERKNVEKALNLSDNLNRRLVENSPSAILIQTQGKIILYANKTAAMLLGANSSEELIGMSTRQFTLPEYEHKIKQRAEEIFKTNKPAVKYEQVFKCLDGTFKTGESIVIPFEYYGQSTILTMVSDITHIKNTLNDLKVSREKLRFFIEHAPVAVAMLDKKMNYIACSKRWLQDWWVGKDMISPEDIIGLNHYEIFPDVPQKWKKHHVEALDGLEVHGENDYFEKQDGSAEWLRWEAKPWLNDKEIGGIMIYTEFITERIKAEKTIQESESRNIALLNAIPDTIFIINKDGTYIDCEASDQSKLIASPELMIGKNLDDFFDEDLTKTFKENIASALETEQTKSLEYSLSIKGVMHYFESRVVKYSKDQALVIVRDITKNKKDEIEAIKSSERFYKVFHISPIPVSISTMDKGILLDMNDKFLELAGFSKEELIGKSSLKMGLWNKPEHRDAFIQELRTKGKVHDFEGELKIQTGEVLNVILYSELLELNGEKCILLMMFDITDRKKAEVKLKKITEELTQYNRELQQFAYITSHNLRAPVVNLSSLLGFYDKKHPENKDNPVIIEKIEQSVRQLDNTLKDLIEIVAVNKKTTEPKSEIEFETILNEIKVGIAEQINTTNTKIVYDFSEAGIIQYPKSYMRSIFQNLITNAIKYRSEERNPLVEIKTTKTPEFVILEVRDNGRGIDLAKYHKKLFGLYQRFHADIEGKGLGLYIIKSQIEELGGQIEVESSVGKGTIFKIFLKKFKK